MCVFFLDSNTNYFFSSWVSSGLPWANGGLPWASTHSFAQAALEQGQNKNSRSYLRDRRSGGAVRDEGLQPGAGGCYHPIVLAASSSGLRLHTASRGPECCA